MNIIIEEFDEGRPSSLEIDTITLGPYQGPDGPFTTQYVRIRKNIDWTLSLDLENLTLLINSLERARTMLVLADALSRNP